MVKFGEYFSYMRHTLISHTHTHTYTFAQLTRISGNCIQMMRSGMIEFTFPSRQISYILYSQSDWELVLLFILSRSITILAHCCNTNRNGHCFIFVKTNHRSLPIPSIRCVCVLVSDFVIFAALIHTIELKNEHTRTHSLTERATKAKKKQTDQIAVELCVWALRLHVAYIVYVCMV